ncbi:hypothetical protein GCM10011403_10870 [Pseudohongiella nitratireducens]|uniref:TonB C-terminal domain-containing protein n=1 Tax=Pseudohongiella nitratireducens TaxID=1768907 RepID=A0A917LSY3_9GAMM|nr:hypothetical protein [Pseudohongiella nitratireducens]GGG55589.1 hypothetical protein GCM10011403_10870 [Pseudohongiella nitratireducens]
MAALSLLFLGYWLPDQVQETIEVREVAIAVPPPPPPPPPSVQQNVVETPVNLQIQGSGPVLQMVEVEPNIDIAPPEIPDIVTEATQWQSLEVNWDAFDLNQLDSPPSLLTALRVNFPRSLSRQGIGEVLVRLDVVIDEEGRATLVEIVENPYPALRGEIERLVRSSRFTAPQKDNESVRARFIWPVEIKS